MAELLKTGVKSSFRSHFINNASTKEAEAKMTAINSQNLTHSFKNSDEYSLVKAVIHDPQNIAAAIEINAQGRPAMVAYLKPLNALFSEADPPGPRFNTHGTHAQIGKMIGEIFYERGYQRDCNQVKIITESAGIYFTPKSATHFRKSKDEV